VRVVWCVLAIYPAALFVLAVAPGFEQLRVACDPPICTSLHWFALTSEQARALADNGFSLDFYALYVSALEVFQALVFTGCGLLIFLRRSGEWIALIAALALIVLGVYLIPNAPGVVLEAYPQLKPLIAATYIWGNWLFPSLLFLLPDGRFAPRWLKWFLLPWPVLVTYTLLTTDVSNPPSQSAADPVLPFVLAASALIGVGGQIYRYRHVATPQMRQQIKWIGFGLIGILMSTVTAAIFVPFPASVGDTPIGVRILALTAVTVGYSFFPIALTFAILRHHLWDIDLVLNRTLVYGALSLIVVAVYVGVVGGLSAIFHAQGAALIAFAGVGLAAVLFHPLRARLQRGVNRLMFGQRDEPYAVLARFGRQLETTPALDTLLPAITNTIKTTLKLPYVRLEVNGQSTRDQPIGDPRPTIAFPLIYQHEAIGRLVVAPRDGEADLSATDRRLLEDLARQAGVAVHAARVTAQLQQARERLVTAREEERRRLRRDLHDGLGPTLAAIAAQAEAAHDLLATQPQHTAALLDVILAQAQTATSDIRRLVYNLRPPALDDLGLVGALQTQGRTMSQPGNLQVTVQADDLPPLPAAVEVAAYRIAQEALANVVRHAQAAHCTIILRLRDGDLTLEIRDDGRGLRVNAEPGLGLKSIRERASELGGEFAVASTSTGGTTVHVRLPISHASSLERTTHLIHETRFTSEADMRPVKHAYRGMMVEYWDLLRGDTSQWSSRPYFLKIIRDSGEPSLDVACGTGRLLLDYLQEGVDIDGVDISPEMIARCRHKAAQAGLSPNLYVQAMQSLNLPRQYQTIIVPSSSFLHVTDVSDALLALGRFLAHLKPGGTLAISMRVYTPDAEAEVWTIVGEAVRPQDGALVRRWFRCKYDMPNRLQDTEDRFEIIKDGEVIETELITAAPYLTWYAVPEALRLLEAAGFVNVHAHSDFKFEPAADDETSYIVLGQRPLSNDRETG
jgi:signal transduction histidine kinase/SAM-dependent methyltransferase